MVSAKGHMSSIWGHFFLRDSCPFTWMVRRFRLLPPNLTDPGKVCAARPLTGGRRIGHLVADGGEKDGVVEGELRGEVGRGGGPKEP